MKSASRYRWFVFAVFFVFMLLHQSDRLLIAPLTSQIMETFDIDEAQMGAVVTGALLVSAFLYSIWGIFTIGSAGQSCWHSPRRSGGLRPG